MKGLSLQRALFILGRKILTRCDWLKFKFMHSRDDLIGVNPPTNDKVPFQLRELKQEKTSLIGSFVGSKLKTFGLKIKSNAIFFQFSLLPLLF